MKTEVYSNGVLVETIDNRTLDEAKKYSLDLIRVATSKAIMDAGIDEKTQLNAASGVYEEERCEAIKSYIAACRNEYLRCKSLILSSNNNDEADAVQFVAPPVSDEL